MMNFLRRLINKPRRSKVKAFWRCLECGNIVHDEILIEGKALENVTCPKCGQGGPSLEHA